MNYIWDILLEAKKTGIPTGNIIFKPAKSINPYMETSFEDLNPDSFNNVVEINAYYRFGEIFQGLLGGDLSDYPEIKAILFDILIHFLGELDVHQGFCKKEYYGQFLENDANSGIYGKKYEGIISRFPFKQRRIVEENMAKLYELGASIELLRSLLGRLHENSLVYLDSVDMKTLLIYIGKKEDEETKKLVEFLLELFIPIDYTIELFWDMHFGIIGVDETMTINELMIY